MEAEAKAAAPGRRHISGSCVAGRRQESDRADGGRRPQHDQVCAQLAGWHDGRVVSSAGVYELWARWGPVEDRTFWATAADVSRDFFNRVTGPERADAGPQQL